MTGKWKPIAEYVEPSGGGGRGHFPDVVLRARKGAAFGYIRDGELFDAEWVYIRDANKATHFSKISAPDPKVVELDTIYLGAQYAPALPAT